MKILIISPSVEDGGVRGIGKLSAEMSHALYYYGHEVILLTGAPKRITYKKNETVSLLAANRYIAHYLKDGWKSEAFMQNGKFDYFIAGIKSVFVNNATLIPNNLNEIVLPNEISQISKHVTDFLQYPYFYKIINRLPKFLAYRVYKKVIKKSGAEIVITTSPSDIPKNNKYKLVQYIHDIMPLETLETPPDSIKHFSALIKSTIKNSDLLLTNSNDTKKKIIELAQTKKLNIETVYIPYDLSALNAIKKVNSNIPRLFGIVKKDYILFNSVLEERKNVERLLRAYATVHKDIKGMPLVLVGGNGYKNHVIYEKYNELPDHVKSTIIFTGYISDEERVALMRSARLFVMPSINEGLGLPVIESLALGTPCLTTHFKAVDEYAPKDGGITFLENPYSTAEISAKLVEALKQSEKDKVYLSTERFAVLRQFSQKLIQERINNLIIGVKS